MPSKAIKSSSTFQSGSIYNLFYVEDSQDLEPFICSDRRHWLTCRNKWPSCQSIETQRGAIIRKKNLV